LPDQALSMIRYHSFYSWHAEGAYRQLMSPKDEERLQWAQAFQPYDLYSKGEGKPDVAALEPYYRELIDQYLPGELRW
jgi:inositol oxygenase